MDIDISFEGAMEQAIWTTDKFFKAALGIIENHTEEIRPSEAVELSKVMASDYHPAVLGMKLQELPDAIREIEIGTE